MNRLLVSTAAALLALGAATEASASWLQPRTQQRAFPLADAERELVVGKSWLVFDLDFSYKFSDTHFIGDSLFNLGFTEGTHFEQERNDGVWHYRRWAIGGRWGFSKNSEIFFSVPVIWGAVWNNRMVDEDGNRNPISAVGLGDVHAGVRFQWLRSISDTGPFSNALATDINVRFPTGDESPGSYIGGPNNVATIITGTGSWGFDLSVRFKQQLAILAIELGLGWEINAVAVVQYLIEDEYNSFNQHIDPGDRAHLDVGFTFQFFDHLAFKLMFDMEYRTPTKWGATKATFPACKDCEELPDSEGFWMDLEGRLIIDVDLHFGLDFYARVPMAGRRNFLWPIEEISPSRGFTGGVDLQVRF
jgi:hypothetical protein